MHRRLLSLTRNTRSALSLTILTGFLAGLLTIGQAFFVSGIVNGVFLEGRTVRDVSIWLQLILVILIARGILIWINEVSSNSIAIKIKTDLRERLFNHILRLGPAYTRARQTGELTTAAVEGIEALDAYFSQYLPQVVLTALVPLSILIVVFPIDMLSGIVMFVTAPLIPFFMILIGKGAGIVTGRQYDTLSRLSSHFLDSLQGLTTLKLFGRSKSHAKNIARVSEQYRDATLKVLRITFLSAFVLELLATISTALIAVEIGFRLLYARMDFREAFFLLILAPEFYIPLRMLGARFHAGMSGTTAAGKIFEILDLPIDEPGAATQIPQGGGPPPLNMSEGSSSAADIQLENVSFTHPDGRSPALENINMKIKAGQHIAVVGKTGAGKSTLADLLMGFISPSSGTLRPLIGERQSRIAWVPQKPHLFHDTLAANIRLGRPDATDDEVIAAAHAANLHQFIGSLPEKYETMIGEGGSRLSSGQAQRLALARAFIKNAPVLILDEPTSSLDPETESELEDSIRRLMKGRTVITMAHRLNTIYRADRIFVLEQGRIVEAGTHRELLALGGQYARLIARNRYDSDRAEIETKLSMLSVSRPSISDIRSSATGSQFEAQKSQSILLRLLGFLDGTWGWIGLSVVLSTLTIGSSVALMGTSAWLISTAALHPSIADLGVSVVGVRFFGLSRGISRYLERLVSHNVTFRLLARLRVWFYEKLEPLAPARLMEYKSGDILARIIGDVDVLENFYVRVISPAFTAVALAVIVTLFFASYQVVLVLILLGLFFVSGVILPILIQRISRPAGTKLIGLRADLQIQLVDGIQGLADLLAFGRGGDRANQIARTGREYASAQRQHSLINGFHSGLTNFLTNFGLWLVLFKIIPLIVGGEFKGVMLGTFALMTVASFEALTPLPLAAHLWNTSREAAKRLFEIVDVKPAVKETEEKHLADYLPSHLQFSSLTFSYSNAGTPVLKDLTFDLDPGASLAIVGPSGAGKSTIVSLLCRFWEFEKGDIRLAGESIKSLDPTELRRRYAIVSQNGYFFNTSIRENLKVARSSASMEEMESAARAAQIHDFVMNLPGGYDTVIGEQGVRLSGGERQRLAIARALLKNSPMLILDEPTANLDPFTERQVLLTLFDLLRGRTTLWITHRLVGLDRVDEILVLDHGAIRERGTHSELAVRDGLYSRMLRLQNQAMPESRGKID